MFNLDKKNFNVFKIRIIFDIILFIAVFYIPWWVIAVLALIGAFLWPPYLEIFIFGILLDVLYGSNAFPFGGAYGILGAIAIFGIATFARRVIR